MKEELEAVDIQDPEWEAEWTRKGELVREVLGENAFDPWRRLEAKAAKGLDISVEARYLEQAGIKPVTPEGQQMRARYLQQAASGS